MSIDPSIPPPTPPPSIPPVPPPSVPPSPAVGSAPSAAEKTPESAAPVSQEHQTAEAGNNTVAILSYLTLVGFIVAVVINKDENKNELGQFHLRQSLGLILLAIAFGVVLSILGQLPWIGGLFAFLLTPVMLVLFVAWIFGFLDALNHRIKPIPFIGEHIQKHLKGAFA